MLAQTNVWLAILGGVVAGYVMFLAGNWMEGVFGLPRMDFGQSGLKYLGGQKPGWWYVGILAHHVDSALLALFYAAAVYPLFSNFGLTQGQVLSGIVGGAAYGIGVYLVLALGLVGGAMVINKQPMAPPGQTGRYVVANVLLHIVYGGFLGVIYLV